MRSRYFLAAEGTGNAMEGEASREDDLDIITVAKRTLDNKSNHSDDVIDVSSGASQTADEVTDLLDPQDKPPKGHENGERIEWSEEDEPGAAYSKFKQRKSLKRKRAAASTRKAKTDAAGSSMVGKKSHRATRLRDEGKPTLKKYDSSKTDSEDDDLVEDTLPDYLKTRYKKWVENTTKMGEAGLRVPPTYDHVDFSDDENLQHLREKPDFPHTKPSAPYKDVVMPYSGGIIPAPIAQWLREYQVKGAEFLHDLFVWQRGGILGDDMGLGKTIQVIAFLTAAFGKTGDERDAKRMRRIRRSSDQHWYPRALIVCPGGLMENWKAELKRWGWWQIDVYHGAPPSKEAALQAASKGRLEIMITTYATYKQNRSAINMVDWDVVIADECHAIKERHSEITKAMNEVNALCRIGLTGTAIQNKYEELWTLLNWTNPGRFGPVSAWKTSISDPLKVGQSHDATVAQLAKARKTAKKLVQNLLPQFFLRRMKTLIADQLPKKSDRVVFCPLTPVQADAYENFVNSDVVTTIRESSEPCDCGSGKKKGWCCYAEIRGRGKWQNHVFPTIVTLQKLANHLASLLPNGTDPKDKQDKDLDNLQLALPDQWRELYRQRDSIINYANQDFCGKWKVLKKLLKWWHGNGDKVLVFSHSVRLLRMLQMLFKTTTPYNVSYLDGGMSYEDRQRAVDEFNSDPVQFVFLISTKAGGVGLNITSANKVVVVDPNWNPSYDLQAQDRAYRIGQTRDVEVFRLVSAGTIEEIVYARQIYKQQQANIGYNASSERRYFRGVQDRKEQKGEIFGLANLFAFQGDGVVLRDIVNKTNVAESKAGVQVIGLDMDMSQDPDNSDGGDEDPLHGGDENAAMSHLAALITSGSERSKQRKISASTKKSDAVSAILAAAGVQYTHENSEVIGSSKVEARLSKRAEATADDIDMIGEYVFPHTQQSQAPNGALDPKHHPCNPPSFEDVGGDAAGGDKDLSSPLRIQHRYHPPEHVRKRQFCTMARHSGFADATEFALVVEGWTQAQRRDCLEGFYRDRRRALG
ncbi:DNA excision repair protein [Cryomyces antarcticus]|nr:hypothetical protein LTR60_000340 [Cryomyces antarcticus]KAK5158147.1 hypothetical protein LTR04_005266 [Oleoguttula sp. CCFEE 6159]